MKNIKIYLVSVAIAMVIGCKQEHTCECYNPGGKFKTYIIKDNKNNARTKCNEYSNEYQQVPMSETYCELK